MTGLSIIISRNVQALVAEKKRTDAGFTDALNITGLERKLFGDSYFSKEDLDELANVFGISVREIVESRQDVYYGDPLRDVMRSVESPSARQALEIADELADMILYYKRLIKNAEEMEQAWEA